jgi:hypothetical protein
MIRTKSGSNSTLKYMLTSIAKPDISLKLYIKTSWYFIMELYFVNFKFQWSSGTYYFKRSNLLDKSCQICQTRPLYTIWDISRDTSGIVLRFKLGWKLDIPSFPTIYVRPSNSSRRERTTCLKSWLKLCQQCAKIRYSGYMEEF